MKNMKGGGGEVEVNGLSLDEPASSVGDEPALEACIPKKLGERQPPAVSAEAPKVLGRHVRERLLVGGLEVVLGEVVGLDRIETETLFRGSSE